MSTAPTPSTSWRIPKMPREQRDTLFILGTIAFIMLPHLTYLPVWACGLTLATLLWRAWLTRGSAKLPGTTVKIALLVLFVGLTLVNFRSIAGPEAGGTLLVMLVSLKTLELRARRDALIIFYLGFFLVMIGFFQSQNIPTAVAMLIALTALMAALINAHMPAGHPPLWDSVRIALRLMLWGTPIMVILFLTFPRFDPLWGLPNSALAKTGVSGELSINSIISLAQDDSIAFRITFDAGRPPAQKDLYFRGPVLNHFDGRTWRELELETSAPVLTQMQASAFALTSPAVGYEITQEITNQKWLFTLDLTPPQGVPELSNRQAQMAYSYQWTVPNIVSERIRYKAQAYLQYRAGQTSSRELLEVETRLPPGSNPRTRAWGQELMQNRSFANLDARGKAQWLLDYIARENYQYTLRPPQGYSAEKSADQLWFDYRSGFCEHYASAFVVLMRSMGIPARIVAGYQGAEANLIDTYWIVRQSNAHAWTEVWQENAGWIRVDPTFAIAPERINNGTMDPAVQANGPRTLANMPFLDKLLMRWDALENNWNQWVLGYTVASGIELLSWLGIQNATWGTLVMLLAGLVGVVLLLAFLFYQWRARHQDPWQKTYGVLRKKLTRAGFSSDLTTAPRTLAQKLKPAIAKKPQLKEVRQLLLQLEKLRYAPTSLQKTTLKEVMRATRRLRLP